MRTADSAERHAGTATRAVARVVLTIYAISLTLIAYWPVPVDAGAGRFLRVVTRVLPALTYPRIEFSSNILLFVPLGVLLMLILRRRHLILPIAIVVTVAIECAQELMLDKRTPSVLDIIANTAGACIGVLIVAVVESMRSRSVRAEAVVPSVESEAHTWAALGIVPPPVPPQPTTGTVSIASSARIPPRPPLPVDLRT